MFKYTFEMTLGCFVARQTRFELEKYCTRENLELKVHESRGLLSSDYQMVVRGPASKWPNVKKDLEVWFKELEEAA